MPALRCWSDSPRCSALLYMNLNRLRDIEGLGGYVMLQRSEGHKVRACWKDASHTNQTGMVWATE